MNDPFLSNSHALLFRRARPARYSLFQMPVWHVTQYAAFFGYSMRSVSRQHALPGGFGSRRRLAASNSFACARRFRTRAVSTLASR